MPLMNSSLTHPCLTDMGSLTAEKTKQLSIRTMYEGSHAVICSDPADLILAPHVSTSWVEGLVG